MSTFIIFQPTTARRAPRRNRWGGFVMSPDTAGAGFTRTVHPIHNFHTICKVILNEVRPYRANFKVIGEVWPDEAQYMLITQSAKFDGYKGMDPGSILQFEEGEQEAIARQLLKKEGVKDYEFKTFLRD